MGGACQLSTRTCNAAAVSGDSLSSDGEPLQESGVFNGTFTEFDTGSNKTTQQYIISFICGPNVILQSRVRTDVHDGHTTRLFL